MIEFDVETEGFQAYSQKQKCFMAQFFDGKEKAAIRLESPQDTEQAQRWFQPRVHYRAWNSKFDRAWAEVSKLTVPGDGYWHDGMVMAHIVNERRSVALKNVGTELFGEDVKDTQKAVHGWLTDERARRKKQAKEDGTELIEPNYADVPNDIMEPYALEDVLLTRKVCNQYEPLLAQSPELKKLYEWEMKVMDALYHVERRGLPADEGAYRKLENEVIGNLDELEDVPIKLAEEAGVKEFNPRSNPQIIEALEARDADMTFMEKKNGRVQSANKENLEACDDALARAILAFRGEYRNLTTYIRPMIGRSYDTSMRHWREPFIAPDGRIHASYRQVGAKTGRMSCANPNIQNQPRDDLRLRYNIVAPEGEKLVCCDLSNIELRVFAAYAGEGRMLTSLKEGKDLHAATAELIGIQDQKRGEYVESARQRGKTYNFSVIYGGGIRTIIKQLHVDKARAQLYKKRYYDVYPEIRSFQDKIEFRLNDQGYIQDLWGRRYRCWDARKEAYKFGNYIVQGTACEILKEALVQLHADKIPVVALIHDEIIACVPEKDAPEVLELVKRRLVEEGEPGGRLHPIVPLEAEGCIVDRWSEAKNKEFKPQWDK